jgi:hypothetical protein
VAKLRNSVEIEGSPVQIMRDEAVLWETSVTVAVAETTEAIKRDWRGQIRAAGLGNRLAGTVRSVVEPERAVSASASGLVYSLADDILAGHEDGSLIAAQDGVFLAIPMPAARQRLPSGGAPTPQEFAKARGIELRLVRTPNGLFLVGEGRLTKRKRAPGFARAKKKLRLKNGRFGSGAATIFLFQLVRQVQLPKRLNLRSSARVIAGRLDNQIVATYRRLE